MSGAKTPLSFICAGSSLAMDNAIGLGLSFYLQKYTRLNQ